MKRRQFIGGRAGAAVWPLAVRAQQPEIPIVGWLHSASAAGPYQSALRGFHSGLAEEGFVDGQNVAFIYNWANDLFDKLPALARDLVRRSATIIFAGGGDVSAIAAKLATSNIPIVFAIGADPGRAGIVASLNEPGGNATGVSFLAVEIRPKMVELIRELIPGVRAIGVLANPNRPNFDRAVNEVMHPAHLAGLTVHVLEAGSETEIEAAFASGRELRVEALLVLSDPVFWNRADQIVRLAQAQAIPAIHGNLEFVTAGGLISYGANIVDAYREAGIYAGRILRGARPAQLPVKQSSRLQLVINLTTAKVLGISVPQSLLARAGELIE